MRGVRETVAVVAVDLVAAAVVVAVVAAEGVVIAIVV